MHLSRTQRLQQKLLLSDIDDNDDDGFDDIDFQVPYRRPKIVDNSDTVDDLSEHVKFRLFLARQLALMKFNDINKNISGMGT